MSAILWHASTKRLVLLDRGEKPWRVTGAGKITPREPTPPFEITPHDDGTFTLGFGPLARRLRAVPAEKPDGPGWVPLDPMSVARIVFGRKRSRGVSLLRLLAKAGSAAAVVQEVGQSLQRALDQVGRTLRSGERIARRD